MKATLQFNLDDQEDRLEHLRCMKATSMASILFDFQHNARKRIESIIEQKEDRGDKILALTAVDMVYDYFNNLLELHGIDVNEIIE